MSVVPKTLQWLDRLWSDCVWLTSFENWLRHLHDDSYFLDKLVTDHGTYVYQYDRKRNVKVQSGKPLGFFRMTIAPSYTSLAATEDFAKFNVQHCRKSPIATTTPSHIFFLFAQVKKDLKGKLFHTIPMTQIGSTRFLNSFTREDFQGDYNQRKNRWQNCVHAQGSYFEEF